MITNNKLDDSVRTDLHSFLKRLWVTVCDDCDCGLKSMSDLKTPIICKRSGYTGKRDMLQDRILLI